MSNASSQALINFIHESPTPFHAVRKMIGQLEAAGYQPLYEQDSWSIQAGGRYYVTRNDSSLIAFKLGKNKLEESGFRMVGAHTDSPCLQVKPQPELNKSGCWQLGVAVYGGALLSPWFDRDLSLAGRVTFTHQGKVQSHLINIESPIAIIPNLAIHLNREANKGWAINQQTELPPIIACSGDTPFDLKALLAKQLFSEYGLQEVELLDYELSFYDNQKGNVVGLNNDFITSARLDNLLSCYTGLEALLHANDEQNCLLICTDHEEVGSCSACGADGPFLEQVLTRLMPDPSALSRCIEKSILVSADNAHAQHPNYPQKHDEQHAPKINAGPVIKINGNQRYASNSITAGIFRHLCQINQVPVQTFVTRSDMGCGSTIGPITASKVGVKTVDIGLPTWAMHSIREVAGTKDLTYMLTILKAFYDIESLY